MSRIGPQDADDLDELLAPFDRRQGAAGHDIFPLPEGVLMPHAALRRSDAVCIGLRAAAVDGTVADRAMRLAAFAIERDVEITVLSETDYSGFERFGFRIERIAGETRRGARRVRGPDPPLLEPRPGALSVSGGGPRVSAARSRHQWTVGD